MCSGPRQGKQFTYARLDTVAPAAAQIGREEALYRLATRYFASKGPASAHDFANWSGLSMAEARRGIASLGARFDRMEIGGKPCYFMPSMIPDDAEGRTTFLLPDYDEYGMSYRDRDFLASAQVPEPPPSEYSHWLVVRGRVTGVWAPDKAGASVAPFGPLSAAEQREVEIAVERYTEYRH